MKANNGTCLNEDSDFAFVSDSYLNDSSDLDYEESKSVGLKRKAQLGTIKPPPADTSMTGCSKPCESTGNGEAQDPGQSGTFKWIRRDIAERTFHNIPH